MEYDKIIKLTSTKSKKVTYIDVFSIHTNYGSVQESFKDIFV